MASQQDGRQMWKQCADADGFISKDVDTVIKDLCITEYDEKREAEKSLILSQNYYDIEFENEKEERWKFAHLEKQPDGLTCLDCTRLYDDFGLDVVLSNEQWK